MKELDEEEEKEKGENHKNHEIDEDIVLLEAIEQLDIKPGTFQKWTYDCESFFGHNVLLLSNSIPSDTFCLHKNCYFVFKLVKTIQNNGKKSDMLQKASCVKKKTF